MRNAIHQDLLEQLVTDLAADLRFIAEELLLTRIEGGYELHPVLVQAINPRKVLGTEYREVQQHLTRYYLVNNQPRPEAVVLGRPPEGAVYVRLPPLGAWSWSGPGFSQAPAEASPLMTNSRLIQCHARVLPSPDQNGKSTPDRSKLFGSHGQRPWF